MAERRSLIEDLIDRAGMRCVVCNARAGTCSCWTRCVKCGWSYRTGEACRNLAHRPHVTLVCPHCKRRKRAAVDSTDPPGTAEVHASCDRCPQDATLVDYFNARGRQIGLDGRVLKRAPPPERRDG